MKKIFLDESLRLNLSKAGFENSKKFSWKVTAIKTLKVYNDIMD
jgi:hypothetical protein